MEILTDPRFSQYLNTTTVNKFFPRNNLSQQSAKRNPIYKLFKENQLLDEQEKLQYKRKIKTEQNLRRSSMSLSESKFIRDKTIQRVRTMNSFIFESNGQNHQKSNKLIISTKKTDNKCSDIIKFNSFSYGVERFQKSLDKQKNKCLLLKKYNKLVQYHFDKFQPNEDRTRYEIVQHQNIIRLLLNREEKKLQNVIPYNNENRILEQELKRRQQQKLQKEKQMKQILTSKHCQQKVQKVINNYLNDLSHTKSQKLIHRKSINLRTFTQQRESVTSTKSLSKIFTVKKQRSIEKNIHNKQNMLQINVLKVPSKDTEMLKNKMVQKSQIKKLTLSKQNNNYFQSQGIKLKISRPTK